jgi:hypothetical protein
MAMHVVLRIDRMRYLRRIQGNKAVYRLPTMFPRDRGPVRIPSGPISPALEPNLQLAGSPIES